MVMFDAHEIRGLRIALGLTASEFAEKIGVCEDTIWRWERGDRHPNFRRMTRLNELREEYIGRKLSRA